MGNANKRRHERKDSLNILHYAVLDENGEPFDEGMGRSLNVSEQGMLLETRSPLLKDHILSITIGLEEEMVEIRGRVTHTNPCEKRTYCSGIEFLEIKKDDKRVLNDFLKALKKSMKP